MPAEPGGSQRRAARTGMMPCLVPAGDAEDLVRGGRVNAAVRARASSLLFTASPGGTSPPEAAEVMRRFPPRPVAQGWPATMQPREQVLARLLGPPLALANRAGQ